MVSGEATGAGGAIASLSGHITNFNKSLYEIGRLTRSSAQEVEGLRTRIERLSSATVLSNSRIAEMYREIRTNTQAMSLWGQQFDSLSRVLSKEFGSEAVNAMRSLTSLGERIPAIFDVIEGKARVTQQTMSQIALIAGPERYIEYSRLLERTLERQQGKIHDNIDSLRKLSDAWDNLRKSGENSIQQLGRGLEPLITGILGASRGFNGALVGGATGIVGGIAGLGGGAVGSGLGAATTSVLGSLLLNRGFNSLINPDRLSMNWIQRVAPLSAGTVSLGGSNYNYSGDPSKGGTGTLTTSSGAAASASTMADFQAYRRGLAAPALQRFNTIASSSLTAVAGIAGLYTMGEQFGGNGRPNWAQAGTAGILGGAVTGGAIGSAGGGPGIVIGAAVGAVVGALASLTGAATSAARSLSEMERDKIRARVRGASDLGLEADPRLKGIDAAITDNDLRARKDQSELEWFNAPGFLGAGRRWARGDQRDKMRASLEGRERRAMELERQREAILNRSTEGYLRTRGQINAELELARPGMQMESSAFEVARASGDVSGAGAAMSRSVQRQQAALDMTIGKMAALGGVAEVQRRATVDNDAVAQQLIATYNELNAAVIQAKRQVADFGYALAQARAEGGFTVAQYDVQRSALSGGSAESRIRGELRAQVNRAQSSIASNVDWFNSRAAGGPLRNLTADRAATMLRNPGQVEAAAQAGGIDVEEAYRRLQEIVSAQRSIMDAQKAYQDNALQEATREVNVRRALSEATIKTMEAEGKGFPQVLAARRDQLKLMEREIGLNNARLAQGNLLEEQRDELKQRNAELEAEIISARKALRLEEFDRWIELLGIGSEKMVIMAEQSRLTGGSIHEQVGLIRQSMIPDREKLNVLLAKMNDPGLDPVEREKVRIEYLREQNSLLEKQLTIYDKLYEFNSGNLNAQKSINESILEIMEAQYRPLTEQMPVRQKMLEISVEEVNQTKEYLQNLIKSNAPTERVRDTAAELAKQYAGIYKQVDYIRQSWLEVLSEQGMQLPGGSYTMPGGLSNWQVYGSGDYPFKRFDDRTPYGGGPGSYEYLHGGLMQRMMGMVGNLDVGGSLKEAAAYVDARSDKLVGGMSSSVNAFQQAVDLFGRAVNFYTGGAPAGRTGSDAFVGSGIEGRAGGGPIVPGRPYMVGEHGPEYFMSDHPGIIYAGKDPRILKKMVGRSYVSDNPPLSIISAGVSGISPSISSRQMIPQVPEWLNQGLVPMRDGTFWNPAQGAYQSGPRQRPAIVAPTGGAGPNIASGGGNAASNGASISGRVVTGANQQAIGNVTIHFDVQALSALVANINANQW
jgi:hypothetical protein